MRNKAQLSFKHYYSFHNIFQLYFTVHATHYHVVKHALHVFFNQKIFYKKMSLKSPQNLRKPQPQTQMPELQFLKTLTFPRALKSYKIE